MQEFDGRVSSQQSGLGGPLSVTTVADGSGGAGRRGTEVGEGGGLWPLLCRELGLAESQEAQVG